MSFHICMHCVTEADNVVHNFTFFSFLNIMQLQSRLGFCVDVPILYKDLGLDIAFHSCQSRIKGHS